MTHAAASAMPAASRAVGRIPSGLFVLGIGTEKSRTGTLVSWVQQAGFEPLMVTVALRPDRPICNDLQIGSRFVLSQLPAGRTDLIRRFAKSTPSGSDDFEGVSVSSDSEHSHWAGPVLTEALACLHAEVSGIIPGGDHLIVLARVLEGFVRDTHGEPHVHIRKSGSHY